MNQAVLFDAFCGVFEAGYWLGILTGFAVYPWIRDGFFMLMKWVFKIPFLRRIERNHTAWILRMCRKGARS